MAIAGEQVALTAGTAVKLTKTPTDSTPGQSVCVFPATVDLYYGGPGVTTSTGAKLTAGLSLDLELDRGEDLWVVSATNTTIHVLHGGI